MVLHVLHDYFGSFLNVINRRSRGRKSLGSAGCQPAVSGSLPDTFLGVAEREVKSSTAQEFAASCREQQASGLCSPECALPSGGRNQWQKISRYPPGFGDFVGTEGVFCGCAFKSWFRGAPGGGIVPGVGPMAGSPGGRSAGGGADVLALSSARSFNHA